MKFDDKKVATKASSQLIESLLDTLELNYAEIGNNVYNIKIDNYSIRLFNKNTDIQLYCAFNVDCNITLSRINEWNKEHRFARAYLDDDNDPVIEADLDFEGGVTAETIVRFIALFSNSVDRFVKHIQ